MGIANISGNIVSDSGVDLTSKADLVGGLIPSSQLPSYVDDVLEYANLASFPATGETGKIYVDLATNKIYRWSGSVYVEVSAQVGTTWGGITGTLSNQTDLQNALNAKQATLSGTGFVKSTAGVISYDTNTYLTTSTVLNTVLTPYAVGANTAVTASDTIETAIEKLQGQVNARLSAESDTLATVTGRGATTATAISLTNTTATTSATTGALVVSGGIGVAGSVFIGTNLTTGRLTMGQGITNQDIYLTITSPGVGFANGFIFTRGSDGAGIKVIETASDATMYEIYMSDNPDGGDMLQFRFTDWQSPNGLVVPIQTSGKTNRYVASTHTFLGGITQNTAGFFTTSNFGGTNGSDNQLQINNVSKLRTVGSTVNITALNTSGYNTSDGNVFWIKLDTTTTFAWGYGSPSGTAVATGIALSTSSTTLSNGIQVTFSATTGAIGDTFVARVYKTASNIFSNITATSFVKSGGTSSQFLKADGTVDSTAYTANLGTVTSVAAITLGTTGTDLSSSVATGTTTPVITLNVPTASATNRGALSSADWNYFSAKQQALNGTGFIKASGSSITYDNTIYTPVSRTLTINGTAYDLSADRSWTISTGSGMRNISSFVATAAQTTFTISGGYTAGLVDVYVNGARLSNADFTATNGTTVVLSTGLVANDVVDIINYVAGLTSGITGAGTTNTISKFTGTSTLGNSLIFDNGTNVGIGNASPSAKLHITGTVLASSTITGSSLIKSGGTSAQILMADGSVITAGTNITISGGVISSSGGGSLSGSGTTNYIPKWSGTTALGNSQIFNNATSVAMFNTANGTGYALEFNNNASQPRIDIVDNGTYTAQLKSTSNEVHLSNSSANAIVFNTAGEKIRILPTGTIKVSGDIRTKMVHFNANSENRGQRVYSRTLDISAYNTASLFRFSVTSGNAVQFHYEITLHLSRLSGNLSETRMMKYQSSIAYNTSGTPDERYWDLVTAAGNGIGNFARSNQTGYFDLQSGAFDTANRATLVVNITCSNWDAVTVTFP